MTSRDITPHHKHRRRFVEAAGLRVVGIENKIRSLKALSQTLLNAAVLQTVEDNGGKKYSTEHLRARIADLSRVQEAGGDGIKMRKEAADRVRTEIAEASRGAPVPSSLEAVVDQGDAGVAGCPGGTFFLKRRAADDNGDGKAPAQSVFELRCPAGSQAPAALAALMRASS